VGVSLLSFVWLQLPALVPCPSYNIKYVCVCDSPFSWICSLYVLFCFEDFYASLFSYAVCNCDQSFLNIDTDNACNKELEGEGGGGIFYATCVKNLFCVAIVEVLTILAVYV
jgi:hypothetical protein